MPAGKALAVDREKFAAAVTAAIEAHPAITVSREEITALPPSTGAPLILATGPLTSESLAESLAGFTGREHLAFYDAIAPIVSADSLDRQIIYQASRYDEGPGDYLNCPMNREQYQTFITALAAADKVPLKDFEEPHYFEGCLPIEVMLARGDDTLRFGPMKPVGLPDPRTGRDPYAVVQLRKENRRGHHLQHGGFPDQTDLQAQQRGLPADPRPGRGRVRPPGQHPSQHLCLRPPGPDPDPAVPERPDLLLAGQFTGVEGYVESTAMGLLAGLNAARLAAGAQPLTPPTGYRPGRLDPTPDRIRSRPLSTIQCQLRPLSAPGQRKPRKNCEDNTVRNRPSAPSTTGVDKTIFNPARLAVIDLPAALRFPGPSAGPSRHRHPADA